MTKLEEGKIVRWLEDRGFGFVRSDGRGDDVFVHISTLKSCGIYEVEIGELVHFERGTGRGGKPAVVTIELA